MTMQYIGLNHGQAGVGIEQNPAILQTGTATNNTDIELRLDLTKNFTRKEVKLFLKTVEAFLICPRNTNILI